MVTITPPENRRCERCGREDCWDNGNDNWTVAGEHGNPFCIHEWNINGTYSPFEA
ncbi:HEWD family protein [Halocatena halophila]|uniref:HEWD family protein n=1 Tax=Halocatena halophila TaxID=2814576 RepID=UPI002ED3C655